MMQAFCPCFLAILTVTGYKLGLENIPGRPEEECWVKILPRKCARCQQETGLLHRAGAWWQISRTTWGPSGWREE